MRIFIVRNFAPWIKREEISITTLIKAVSEMESGLYEAKLGKGKRGGYRTFIAFKVKELAIFLYGFAKNQQDDLSSLELKLYRKLAYHYLMLSEEQLVQLINNGELVEITDEELK